MMNEVLIQPKDLVGAAQQFELASQQILDILKNLDETTGKLENQWGGTAKQTFYREYQELRGYIQGFSVLLSQIAIEMKAIAERIEKTDI